MLEPTVAASSTPSTAIAAPTTPSKRHPLVTAALAAPAAIAAP
jgi:hypothetical protein